MNKHFRILIAAITIMAFLAACASHRYTVVEPPKASLTNYSVLEIPEFDSNLKSAEAVELAKVFGDRLMREIASYRAQHPEDVVYDTVVKSTDRVDDVLVMQGTVISYEEGSRAKRYFIGLGSGKAYCTIQVKFLDKATGEELARTNFDGELMGGIFGGSAEEAVDGTVKAFLDYMAEYMGEGS
jgi:hypothetical protein